MSLNLTHTTNRKEHQQPRAKNFKKSKKENLILEILSRKLPGLVIKLSSASITTLSFIETYANLMGRVVTLPLEISEILCSKINSVALSVFDCEIDVNLPENENCWCKSYIRQQKLSRYSILSELKYVIFTPYIAHALLISEIFLRPILHLAQFIKEIGLTICTAKKLSLKKIKFQLVSALAKSIAIPVNLIQLPIICLIGMTLTIGKKSV